jgi:ribosomal protein S18 acetylase RimI-like enzyme
MAFTIRSMLNVDWVNSGLGGISLTEQPVEPPHFKDYDAFGDRPLTWARRWDISNWGIFIARESGAPVGGAAIAWRTPGLHMLEGRDDLAVLWDLRVNTDRRRQGIGRQLFTRATSWAKKRKCRSMKIETQNNNVPACRFYAGCRCRLCGVHPGVYVDLPEEIMLLWYLSVHLPRPSSR